MSTIRIVDHPDLKTTLIRPLNIGELIESNPDMRPVVVEGILRRGETANIIAAAKVGKSFLAGGLAWAIATGTDWLSHGVVQGRVLIIDNELHAETLANRLYRIGTDMMINVSEYADAIHVISLRGENIDIHHIEHRLDEIQAGTYTLCIVDALYRTIPVGTSENDNSAMMAIYNKLDYYAGKWQTAIAVVHHSSKGAQGDKSVTDVGSGAGSISRAADTHIVIRAHEDPKLSVLECVTRSFKSPDPVSIRFDWPLWNAVAVDPVVKKLGQQNDERRAKEDTEADSLLLNAFAKNERYLSESQLVRATGMGPTRVSRAIGRAVSSDSLHQKNVKRQNRKVAVYRPTATPTATR
ncbi:MAG TPA: AAA family ATPase [Pirellula sp.]|nr:AAA family ATPase [Pirellula sp.]